MAGIIPPFQSSPTQQVQTRLVTLADTDVVFGETLVRPGIARYANTILPLSRIDEANASSLSSPVTGTARRIDLDPEIPDNAVLIAEGINDLFEITPLPFFIESVLRSLPGGVPTFYLGIRSVDQQAFEEDETIPQSRTLGVSDIFYFGAIFQDRVCLEPWSWGFSIQQALETVGEDASTWTDFIDTLYPINNSRIIKVLDHQGQIHPPTQFTITMNGVTETHNSAEDGILDLSFSFGQEIELQWLGDPNDGEAVSLPVMAIYETGNSANPDNLLQLQTSFSRGHLQLFELANWFVSPNTGSDLDRYHTNSKVEPLSDGYQTFKLIASDMINCVPETPHPPDQRNLSGAHFAGWSFTDLILDNDLLDENGKPYTYQNLVSHLVNNNCDVHLLVNKLYSVPGDIDTIAKRNALFIAWLITGVILAASELDIAETNAGGKIVIGALHVILWIGIFSVDDLNTKLEDWKDPSSTIFPEINEIREKLAIRSEYPALHEDNPLFKILTVPTPDPITLTEFLTGVGTWHQKIQLFKRTQGKFDELGNQFIGYLGGMDMNENRIDNFGRQGKSPYHDVHARVTGPGVVDIFKSWEERYEYELAIGQDAEEMAKLFRVPLPADLPPNEQSKHIIQIGRTLFRPADPGSDHAFSFALEGDISINENILRAIRGAKEYIYIEDQYFVPNESSTTDNVYLNALLNAADHCKRLIVLTPSIMSLEDIPFGHERRADVVSQLTERWGSDRVLIGAPMRRPVLAPSGGITYEGRCILYEDASALSQEIKIGPKARLPKALPFWIWINGELMLAVEILDANIRIDGHPVVSLKVLRGNIGSNSGWGATSREHPKGSAVTAAQLRGIFVHAKTMMVDDIHVYIGSANINRRGLYHDGEIGVFAVPEQLRSAPDNPARRLRTELWAEQLGIPPSMGPALLQDPIAAFELFRRHFMGGNRFVPLSLFDFNDDADLKFSISTNLLVNALANFGMTWLVTQRDDIYNTLTDPTTIDDPDATPGP